MPVESYDSIAKIPSPPLRPPNPNDRNSDVDCDGIPDWEEMEKIYITGLKTDPTKRDTDGDGIWDGIEIGRFFSPDPLCAAYYFPRHLLKQTGRTITDPTRIDSDCDGLSDGREDANINGFLDPGETDPTKVDTDGDGLWDGLELGITRANAADPANCPNTRYPLENCPQPRLTDPLKPDTDNDGLSDGMEDANRNGCFEPELHETDPRFPNDFPREVIDACATENLVPIDIQRNFNAQIAMGLPMSFANSYSDMQRGTTRGLMGADASRNVAFVAWRHDRTIVNTLNALRQLAENHASTLGGTPTIGSFSSWDTLSGRDNAFSVTFHMTGNMSAPARVNQIASQLLGNGTGNLAPAGTTANTQYVRAQYVLRDNGEVIVVMAVALDNADGSPGSFGLMDVAGGAALARFFDRTSPQCQRALATRDEVDFVFVVDDSRSMESSQNQLAAAGAAMAALLDNSTLNWRAALVTSSYHADYVYNYSSKLYSQIPNLSFPTPNQNIIRGFTRDAQQFQSWLREGSTCQLGRCTPGRNHGAWTGLAPACGGGIPSVDGAHGGCWIGVDGIGYEGMLGSARLALRNLNCNTTSDSCFRRDADIVVIILSDTEDQTMALNVSGAEFTPGMQFFQNIELWENIQHFVDFFLGETTSVPRRTGIAANAISNVTLPPIRARETIQVHAIYCPAGKDCGDSVTVPAYLPHGITRIEQVVHATGGFSTAIVNDDGTPNNTGISNTMRAIVDRAISGGGVEIDKPFIGASLRVAIASSMGTCNRANVPRSRAHGYDYDGIAQTVSFFGNCRPAGQESPVAISYRAWEASDQNRLPCQDDPRFDPRSPDYCQGNFVCDFDADICDCPTAVCNSCSVDYECDTTSCECVHVPPTPP